MRASEILGKEIKEYLACINVAKVNDYDLSRMIIVIAQNIEDREQSSRQELLATMYGNDPEDDLNDRKVQKIHAEIRKIEAQADQIRRSSPKQ